MYTVYRLYDAERNLLYVGMTSNLKRRLQHHSSQREWWPDVAETETEAFASVAEAASAECAQIQTLAPRYNITRSKAYVRKPRQYVRLADMKVDAAKLRRLSLRFNHEGFCDGLYVHRKTLRDHRFRRLRRYS